MDAESDTWQVDVVDGAAVVSRSLGDGWRLEHRVVVERGSPVIVETRLRPGSHGADPHGGIDSDLVRRITLRGVREAAEQVLPASLDGDLRHVEAVSPATRRKGEARRWSLAATALAYVRAVKAGSRRPGEDVAEALGIDVRTVRDRLYAARREEPPLLTGGGRRGVIGDPEFTAAGIDVLGARLSRLAASFGQASGEPGLTIRGDAFGFDRITSELLRDAETRIPGLWEMELDEIASRAEEELPWWVAEIRAGKELRLTDRGFTLAEPRGTAPMTRRGPHEGSIHLRKDGRWAGSVHVGWIDGKRVRKHVLGRTRGEVVAKLDVLLRANREQRPIPDQRAKVGPFLRAWLEDVAKPTIRVSTYDSYRAIVEHHLVPGLGRVPLAKLTPADVQAFLNRKREGGLSPRRVQMLHAVLRRALVTAERWGLVSRNVARLASAPRVPKHEIRPLTPEQAQLLIEASAEDRFRGLYVTALGTGLRQGELLALRWEDVDLEAGRLRVNHTLARIDGKLVLLEPKTDWSRRTVMLPEVVVAALQAHRTRQKMERFVAGSRWVDTGHVFTTAIGTPLEAAVVTRAFQRALDRAGLPKSRFHDLRHAAATFALSQGFTLEDVKNLLGHSSIVLTSNTYGHVLEQRQQAVARGMDAVLGG